MQNITAKVLCLCVTVVIAVSESETDCTEPAQKLV